MEEEDDAEEIANNLLSTLALFIGTAFSPLVFFGAQNRFPVLFRFDQIAIVAAVTALTTLFVVRALYKAFTDGKKSPPALAFVMGFILCGAFIFWINGKYDTSEGKEYVMPIESKYSERVSPLFGKGGFCKQYWRYYTIVRFNPYEDNQKHLWLVELRLPIKAEKETKLRTMSGRDFTCHKEDMVAGERLIPKKSNAVVTIHDGFFGIRWRGDYHFVEKDAL